MITNDLFFFLLIYRFLKTIYENFGKKLLQFTYFYCCPVFKKYGDPSLETIYHDFFLSIGCSCLEFIVIVILHNRFID